MKRIKEIKTIVQTNPEKFDQFIKSAIAEGFELDRYGVERTGADESRLIAFLVKTEEEPEEDDPILKENRALKERLTHLLKSKTISLFDMKDPFTGMYVRDINRLDTYGMHYKIREYERANGVRSE